MAKPFTPEQREELKTRIVELVHQDGRVTIRQLSDETGISRASVGRLCMELVASGDVYNSGCGLFPSEQARKDWQSARILSGDIVGAGCRQSSSNSLIVCFVTAPIS